MDSINFDYKVIQDCTDVEELINYLAEITTDVKEDIPDILILDYDFGGGPTGLDAIQDIREFCPTLPILILTTFDDDLFDDARKKYNIDYVQKPVKRTDLRFRIKSIIDRMQDWEILQKKITENEDLMSYLDKETAPYSVPDVKLVTTGPQERVVKEDVIKILPQDTLKLIQNIFPDIEFLPKAFRLLTKSNSLGNKAEWNRMFRCLKLIDWKNEKNAPAGVKIQKFQSNGKCNYENTWEYRISQAGRIFAQ